MTPPNDHSMVISAKAGQTSASSATMAAPAWPPCRCSRTSRPRRRRSGWDGTRSSTLAMGFVASAVIFHPPTQVSQSKFNQRLRSINRNKPYSDNVVNRPACGGRRPFGAAPRGELTLEPPAQGHLVAHLQARLSMLRSCAAEEAISPLCQRVMEYRSSWRISENYEQ